jgi:polysaccharide export outer membrane protein
VGERAKLREETSADVAISLISLWPMTILRLLLFLLVCSAVCTSCTIVPSRSLPLSESAAARLPVPERPIGRVGPEQGPESASERDKLIDISRETLDEREYLQRRFVGKKVVFPDELEALYGPDTQPTGYTIGPEDVLRLFVWQNPDLSGETIVRPDGYISLPLVGEIQTSGLTVTELQSKLTAAYREFIADPQIAVIPEKLNSRRIFFLGQIRGTEEMAKQGGLFLRGNSTLLENVTGIEFLPDADLAEAFVTRKDVIIPVNLERLIKGGDLSQNIRLQPADTVVVPAATKDILMLGALNKPGRYKLKQRDTLLSALAMAEGLAENADLLQAYLAREGAILPINFKRLLEDADTSQNLLLKDKDFIYVPDVNDNKVFVLGEAVRPGIVRFNEEITIIEALAQVGDVTDRAQRSRVLVVRGNLRQPQIIEVDVNEIVRGQQNPFPLQRNDIVYVTRSALGSWNRLLTLLLPSLQAILTALSVQGLVQ